MRNLLDSHTLGLAFFLLIFPPSIVTLQYRMSVCYESRKRELKTRPIHECRCDERLKTKTKELKHLVYTGLLFIMNRENDTGLQDKTN